MSQRRRAAEVAEKKAADAIRADDVIEEVIPEARSLNSAPLQSSNGKPSLAGAAAKAKLGGTKPKANKDTEVKQLEEKADEEEKEKTMKFDKNKKESGGGKRGEASTHDRLSSAGKKGASVRWSRERQEQEGGPDPEYKLKPENEDDKEAYKEEFDEEPEEEPEEEETNEEENEGESKGERMHKIRVEAGKKAIATRKARVKEQDPAVKTEKDADAALHDQLSAIGKKGASTRWSRDKDEDNGGDEENQGEGKDKEVRLHDIRVQAGKKAMATRKQRLKEQDLGVQSDEEADEALHEQLSAIGKKGAAARWSRDKGQGGDEGEGEEYQEEEDEDREARLHNIRVQAGKKAMATRKQRLKEQDPGLQSDEEADAVLHEQLSAIGKKGASARWSREKGEGSAEEEEGDEDEDEKAARLHRTRVEAGKKAAATRKAHAQQQQNSAGESDDGDASTHDKLVAAGKKGAATRWARAKKRDSEGENENGNEDNGNMKKARGSSRVAMEHWKALEIQELFLLHSTDLVVDINVSAPRRGAFEIIVTNSRGVETTLWSGLKRGPPRRLKFPDPDVLIAGLKEALA